jgi:clan AA aspartic protease
MGSTLAKVEVSNAERLDLKVELNLLVDSGVTYTIVHGDLLRKLQVKPIEERVFTLADGRKVRRAMGGVRIRIGDRHGFSSVIFGEESDQELLGVTALEELGLELDPVSRQLRPAELFML